MIKRLWNWGVEKFLNKEFIVFCVIGVLNTAIHIGTLYLVYLLLDCGDLLITSGDKWIRVLIANAFAFTVASVFSYFANNRFTFKNKKASWRKFFETIVVFVARLILTELITLAFVAIFKAVSLGGIWIDYVAPFGASILMIPITYVVLARILGQKKEEIIKKTEEEAEK